MIKTTALTVFSIEIKWIVSVRSRGVCFFVSEMRFAQINASKKTCFESPARISVFPPQGNPSKPKVLSSMISSFVDMPLSAIIKAFAGFSCINSRETSSETSNVFRSRLLTPMIFAPIRFAISISLQSVDFYKSVPCLSVKFLSELEKIH